MVQSSSTRTSCIGGSGARTANTTASLRVRFAFPQFASLGGVEWYGTLGSL